MMGIAEGTEKINLRTRAEQLALGLKLRGLSAYRLSRLAGTSPEVVQRALRPRRNQRPKPVTWDKLATGLGCYWDGDTLRMRARR